MAILHLYRCPGIPASARRTLLGEARRRVDPAIEAIDTEVCLNVEVDRDPRPDELATLRWLLAETFEPDLLASSTFLEAADGSVIEVGPRLSFETAFSTNATAICRACGLNLVRRLERSRRYLVRSAEVLSSALENAFVDLVSDRMTECRYPEPLRSFALDVEPEPVATVPVLQQGSEALRVIDRELGLAFDEWDLEYYTRLFAEKMCRNPTNVECFDVAQSNSEHSRHWFFKGRLVIDGEEMPESLMSIVRQPLEARHGRSVIAFSDNASAIGGFEAETLQPEHPRVPSPYRSRRLEEHVTLTAETHNFPSGVAPFPGAETGTGGRIRDGHAVGRGSHVTGGTTGYCVGNLRIPGYELPWEDPSFENPTNLASPVQIEIEASNGASDYGNKFGEPVIQGFTRSFGLRLPDGERREWLKPIMFSGGIGRIDARHTRKGAPEPGMLLVKVGGPAYRIGMGGGAASSMVQGENVAELDLNAVQRGDAEMEQKLNRVVRACVELGDANPIVSIHDQGAGGNCNVLKELVEPEGARIEVRAIPVGDETLSVLELWGAEYQENDALLIRPDKEELFRRLCEREQTPFAVVGRVTGDGRVVVHDERDGSTPVDLVLDDVLGDMPRKTFHLSRLEPRREPLALPSDLDVRSALERVFRLVSVGSKRFLTTKVDRAVTGLVAGQPCTGPLQLTVADTAVVAYSHRTRRGAATAIGEQPILGLLDPAAMARMSVGEALTNLVWAPVTALEDVRCSANWMWAAKLPGEGAALYDAARAVRDVMLELRIAVDGGKDSLSMAALAPDGSGGSETVKAPGALVISAYAPCPDVEKAVTPDLERPEGGRIVLIDLAHGRARLGGSALAHVFSQLGDEPPDVEDATLLRRAFHAVQRLIDKRLIAAGHDRSDGGLVTTLLEMAFSGDCGLEVDVPTVGNGALATLFCEELGLVLETDEATLTDVVSGLEEADVPHAVIGRTTADKRIRIRTDGRPALDEPMVDLRDLWEATSFALDRLQADPERVAEEQAGLRARHAPAYDLSFTPAPTAPAILSRASRPRVAVLRAEGSNGDREMAAAFFEAGFEPWDVAMSDLLYGRITLDGFRGLAAVGGFSYADVLDSAKGWAGVIRFNGGLRRQFETFADRADTFSLGVCNGCQLLALLGWVPWSGIHDTVQPRFITNESGRFESRFTTVTVLESPAIMLRGMAGSTLGIWLQHGEGRVHFPSREHLQTVLDERLAPIRYTDDDGTITQAYPHNPNGSPHGIASLCSPNGRHLAMMPHPERTFLTWQWGWMPSEWRRDLSASPWLKPFQNAREWCDVTTP